MKKRRTTIYYILIDFAAAVIAWTIFNFYRKTQIDSLRYGQIPESIYDKTFFLSVIILSLAWVLVYYLSGAYNNVLRKSRINEFVQTLAMSIIGVTVLFFVLLLDDSVVSYRLYYKMYFVLFSAHFLITSIFRFLLSTNTNRKIHKREFGFKTIIIGSNERALNMFTEIKSLKAGIGNTLDPPFGCIVNPTHAFLLGRCFSQPAKTR